MRNLRDNSPNPPRHALPARRGAVAVMVAILMVVLLGCAAMAVDVGYLYVARTELQRAADAAALAGASGLGRPLDSPFGEYLIANDIYSRAESYAQLNDCTIQGVVLNRNTDITMGFMNDPYGLNASLQILPLDQCNVVRVVAHRSASNTVGKIPLFFAPIWGINSSGVSASAIAVLDDRFYAYRGGNAIPFTLHIDDWNDQVVQGNGTDDFGYNKYTGSITTSSDGVPEAKLFPNKEKGKGGGSAGAGNFGILHIGSGSNGVPIIRDQILNGIDPQEFVDHTGEPMIKFYDYDDGDQVSYGIEGDPGIKAGMEDAIQQKVGQVVGIFIHNNVSGSGSNAVFTVIGMRFVRVMDVDLNGNDKAIMVQPVPYYGQGIMTSPNAPPTDKLIAHLQLVR